MRKVFRNKDGDLIGDPIAYSLEILSKNKGAKIYVGADSQKRRKSIEFAVVIAYRYGKRGVHYIYHRWKELRKEYPYRGDDLVVKRLTDEIHASIEIAGLLRENSINVYQIDLDLNGNPKWKSNRLTSFL